MTGATSAVDSWGNLRGSSSTGVLFGYQGAPVDGNTGLVDMVTRNYDPGQGRFATKDVLFGTLDIPLSINQFVYAGANPVTLDDPTGMWVATPPRCK